jgi:hypothetical protein
VGVGVVVALPDSPAEAAGLISGDVIVAVDGITVTAAADLAALISGYAPGDEVVLSVQRSGETDAQPVAVTLAGRPDDDDEAYLGVSVAPAIDADAYEDFDEDHEWDDGEGWDDPDEQWECPFHEGDGYPNHGHPGWRRPMMPHYGHPHDHDGWHDPSDMRYSGMRTPWRIPYQGQGYSWHR